MEYCCRILDFWIGGLTANCFAYISLHEALHRDVCYFSTFGEASLPTVLGHNSDQESGSHHAHRGLHGEALVKRRLRTSANLRCLKRACLRRYVCTDAVQAHLPAF